MWAFWADMSLLPNNLSPRGHFQRADVATAHLVVVIIDVGNTDASETALKRVAKVRRLKHVTSFTERSIRFERSLIAT